MPVEGAIAERARAILPVTWDALSGDPRFGDGLLQTAVDTAKEYLFGRVITGTDESAQPGIVVDYAAKLVALELIAPGIDFWMNQPMSETATGTNESHTFTDRVQALEDLRKALLEETRRKWGEIGSLIGFRRARSSAPRMNTLDDELLTPSPQEFPRPFARTARS